MNILMIAIVIGIVIYAIYFINKHGDTVDRVHKKNIDAHTTMHHDPHRGRNNRHHKVEM